VNDVRQVRITDTTLRDGSHAMRHQFTVEQVRSVATALDLAGVAVIEVAHGDGLGGSSFNYGFSGTPELELIAAAADATSQAKIASLLLPGVGTIEHMHRALDAGIEVVRVATHATEADVSIQHFQEARKLGLETAGFLMLSHRATPEELAAQARIMVDAGCQCVYIVDSAGAMVLEQVGDRVAAIVEEVGTNAEVGFHGHQNLSMGVANSVIAFRAGARQIDGTLCALGAGAGNSPTEVLVATFDHLEINTGIDRELILKAADEVARPMIREFPMINRDSIISGTAGVYSSFLKHSEVASERYGVPVRDILAEVGRRGFVGGQEDMIIDVAVALSASAR
jgi:4-hydroxy 2-oxovalerate aldolase